MGESPGDRFGLATATEAAEALHVSDATLRRWAEAGRLAFVRTPGGHRRYPVAEVQRLRRELAGDEQGLAPAPRGRLPRLADFLEAHGRPPVFAVLDHAAARWGRDPDRFGRADLLLRALVRACREGRYAPLRDLLLAAAKQNILSGAPAAGAVSTLVDVEVALLRRMAELGIGPDEGADDLRQVMTHLREHLVDGLVRVDEPAEASWSAVWRALSDCPIPLAAIDVAGRPLAVNAAAEALSGRPASELLGEHALRMVTPPRLLAAHHRVVNASGSAGLRAQSGAIVEWALLRPDGTEVPVELTLTELRGADAGSPVLLLAVRDIGDRVATADRHDLFAALVEHDPQAAWTTSARLEVVSWNAAAAGLLGWTADEVVGRPLAQLVPAGQQAELHAIHTRLLGGERVHEFETVRLHRDGSLVPVRLVVAPVHRDGHLVGSVTRARPR